MKKELSIEKKMNLLPPRMPNFIKISRASAKKEDGFDPNNTWQISITELSIKEAEEYGELMKQAFINHHKEKQHISAGK